MDRAIGVAVSGGALAPHGTEFAHPRFGLLRLQRRRLPPCWEGRYHFAPQGQVVTLRFETTALLELPGPDHELFLDYLEGRFGLALAMALPPIKHALQHYVKPTVLRTMLDEFTLVSVTVPADPCAPLPAYELGYECLSNPALSFAVMFKGWLGWPVPQVSVRVDFKDTEAFQP